MCPGGKCPGGMFPWGKCPGGTCPGGLCPRKRDAYFQTLKVGQIALYVYTIYARLLTKYIIFVWTL